MRIFSCPESYSAPFITHSFFIIFFFLLLGILLHQIWTEMMRFCSPKKKNPEKQRKKKVRNFDCVCSLMIFIMYLVFVSRYISCENTRIFFLCIFTHATQTAILLYLILKYERDRLQLQNVFVCLSSIPSSSVCEL